MYRLFPRQGSCPLVVCCAKYQVTTLWYLIQTKEIFHEYLNEVKWSKWPPRTDWLQSVSDKGPGSAYLPWSLSLWSSSYSLPLFEEMTISFFQALSDQTTLPCCLNIACSSVAYIRLEAQPSPTWWARSLLRPILITHRGHITNPPTTASARQIWPASSKTPPGSK